MDEIKSLDNVAAVQTQEEAYDAFNRFGCSSTWNTPNLTRHCSQLCEGRRCKAICIYTTTCMEI